MKNKITYPDVFVVFAEDMYDDISCTERHLYSINSTEEKAKKEVKRLNKKKSGYCNAYYEPWSIQ